MKRKAEEHEELPQSKSLRTITTNTASVITFCFKENAGTTHTAKQLTSFLSAKLKVTSREWLGRVLLYSAQSKQLYVYDVLAKRIVFTIPASEEYEPDLMQLRDGTIVVCQDDTISLYTDNGTLIQSTECEQYLPHSIELRNGNILFISNNSAQSVAGIFYRKENKVEELCRSTFEYISVAQFRDGRLLFSDGSNVDLFDESLNHLQAFDEKEWMSHYSQHQKEFEYFSTEGDYLDIDTDDFTWQEKKITDASVALQLGNGILVLKASRPKFLMFAEGTVIKKTIESSFRLLTEIDCGVVAYVNKATKQVNTYNTNTDKLSEYPLPDDGHLVVLLLQNKIE